MNIKPYGSFVYDGFIFYIKRFVHVRCAVPAAVCDDDDSRVYPLGIFNRRNEDGKSMEKSGRPRTIRTAVCQSRTRIRFRAPKVVGRKRVWIRARIS